MVSRLDRDEEEDVVCLIMRLSRSMRGKRTTLHVRTSLGQVQVRI